MPDDIIIPEQKLDENTALTIQSNETQTMWNNDTLMKRSFAAAKYLASSDLVPEQTYKDKPANCLIALDIANRLNMPPMLIMQNLYIVKGKPAWSGSFCAAAINGCGKFSPLEYIFTDEGGGGCFARATRLINGSVCQSDTITMQMAADEGWLGKSGSKWKTMPKQMMMYRAASFFARAHCPEVLLGIQTVEETQDVRGYEDDEKETVTITLAALQGKEAE
jgi:hypothetical protein